GGANHGPSDMSGTGLPNRAKLTTYQRPHASTATDAASARSRTGFVRPQQSGTHRIVAIAIGTPVRFVPAAKPANRPARTAAWRSRSDTSDTAAAVVITSSKRSAFADATMKATAGQPSVMIAAIDGASG